MFLAELRYQMYWSNEFECIIFFLVVFPFFVRVIYIEYSRYKLRIITKNIANVSRAIIAQNDWNASRSFPLFHFELW